MPDANGNAAGPASGVGPNSAPETSELLDPANDIQLTRRNSFEVSVAKHQVHAAVNHELTYTGCCVSCAANDEYHRVLILWRALCHVSDAGVV